MEIKELQEKREQVQAIHDNADEGSNAKVIASALLPLIDAEIASRQTDTA